MGDILSQEEIDELLEVAEGTEGIDGLLKSAGISGEEANAFLRLLVGLTLSELSPEERAVRALEGLDRLLANFSVSQEQTENLRARIQEFVVPPEQTEAVTSQEPQVLSHDFRKPARFTKDHLRTLEYLHDNFARLLSTTFSGAMRLVVDVDTAFVDQTTYAEFIMSLSNPSCSYQFTLGPTLGQAIMDISLPVAFAFVDRIFGGRGSSQGVDARHLTAIEMKVLNEFAQRVVSDLEAAWAPMLKAEISDLKLETTPDFMLVSPASEYVALLAFEMNSTNASGLVSVCYPFLTLESILPRLSLHSYTSPSRMNREERVLHNRLHLGPMELPMRVELGRTQISLGEARGLQVGDIICLPERQDGPAVVFVGGQPKYLAYPFAGKGERIRVKIVGEIPRGYEGRYGER